MLTNAYHMSKMIQILNVPDDPHTTLLPSVWRYRHTLSAYDAVYVVLAETGGATLTTRDPRLASAHGHTAKIGLFWKIPPSTAEAWQSWITLADTA